MDVSIQAQSDTQLNVTMPSSAPYMRISKAKEDGKQRLWVPYAMSTIEDTRTQDFVLTIIGSAINLSDSTIPEALFSVSATGAQDRNVKVRVDLQPYPSCRHTDVGTEGITATVVHDQAGMRIRMIARDTDSFIVTKTLCKFTVELVYEGVLPALNVTLAVLRNSSNPSEYYADILPRSIRREGVYRLIVLMHQAWNDDDRNIGPATCEPRHWKQKEQQTSFQVVCSSGFQAEDSRTCTQTVLSSIPVEGIAAGTVLAFCAGLLIFYIRKNPGKNLPFV